MNAGREFFTIVNGAAGGGRCRSNADQALSRLREAGLELKIEFTEAPGHASELAREAHRAGRRHFLCVGGDGTAYEVINGLFPHDGDEKITLGMLPLGTGNSFLRDFGVTHEDAAIRAITDGHSRMVDVIRVDHRDGVLHYMNLLGIGFMAQVGDLTNEHFKALGPAGYIAGVLTKVVTLDHAVDPILVDDRDELREPCVFVSFSNSKFTGGAMMMAPHADPSDGKLDVIRAGALNRRELLSAFPKVFQGTHVERADVDERLASTVEFLDEREQPVMIDGEVVSLALKKLTVLPGALEVLI